MPIADYLNPLHSPPLPPQLHDMSAATRALHEAIDAAMRRSGLPYLNPDGGPTVQLDLLGSKRMADWQEGKVAFLFEGEGCWSDLPQVYARYGTEPTRQLLAKVRELEGAECAVLTDCGAQAAALLMDGVLERGKHVVVSRQLYNKTRKYAEWSQDRLGGTVTLIDQAEPELVDAAIQANTVLVLAETYTNPLMRALDPDALSDLIVRRRKTDAPDLRLAIDTTIASPWGVKAPLLTRRGIDFVFASGTKALGGQDRDMWGYIASNRSEQMNQIMDVQAFRGGILDWRRAQVVLEGLPHAELAFQKRCANALKIVEFLITHPLIDGVFHPSVPGHPDRAAIDRAYALQGSLMSFRLNGADEARTRHFCDVLAMTIAVRYALSFDGPTTKLNHHQSVSEYFTPVAELQKQGIDRLVRLGAGEEDADDICACLNWALWHHEAVTADEVREWQQVRAKALGIFGA